MKETILPPILPHSVTLEVRDRCLCLQAQRFARLLARHFDQALKPFGLTNGQFSLMMALNRPEPPRINTLAAFLSLDRTSVTAALKPLTRRGLVRLAEAGEDRRERRPVLTEAGSALLAAAVPFWREAHDQLDEALSDPDALRNALAEVDLCEGR